MGQTVNGLGHIHNYAHIVLNDEQGNAITVAEPEHFCRSCHDYAAVTIDCFQCHASRPEVKQKMQMKIMPDNHQEMIDKQKEMPNTELLNTETRDPKAKNESTK